MKIHLSNAGFLLVGTLLSLIAQIERGQWTIGGLVFGIICCFSISGYLAHKERRAEKSDARIFEREPGNGRLAARLIFQSTTVEDAEAIFDRFNETPYRTNDVYPSVAFADKMIETDPNAATDLFLELGISFPQQEVKEAEMYIRKLRNLSEAEFRRKQK